MKRVTVGVVLSGLLGAGAATVTPAESPVTTRIARPAGISGTVVVPDKLLRRWDPLTVFFERDLGPAHGGAEDHPERLVKVTPAQAGAFRWLDARTLQFQPAEPWPALQRVAVEVEGRVTRLSTLMAEPTRTTPADGEDGLEPVGEITLAFPEPLDAQALKQMVSVELRPLPGVGSGGSRTLAREDFEIKPLERQARGSEAVYVLGLRQPVPLGTRAVVHLRLSLDDTEGQSFRQVSFRTAEPFRVLSLGCRQKQFPITPQGTRYPREQAIDCGNEGRSVIVEFSSPPAAVGPVEARNLVRFTPAVRDLSFNLQGRSLEISGAFDADTLYAVGLVPAPLTDQRQRPLDLRERSELFVFFPRKAAFVRWQHSQGILERFGPQMVPVEGRGQTRLDLRIHKIAPLDRSLWPLPDRAVTVDESARPPGPGEEPAPHTDPSRPISVSELQRQLASLGSPLFSGLLDLPLRREGAAAVFGLDLRPYLTKIAGADEPGSYLVGLRDPSGPSRRAWMRVQVTDLSLSTLEEPLAVRFAVTSIKSGLPVAGASVRLEGTYSSHRTTEWATLAEGTTGADGSFAWPAPGSERDLTRTVRRILVEKDGDRLVLDPTRAPDVYADNQWAASRESWLQWAFENLAGRGPQADLLAHLFTERPVYRPEEPVHIKGYLRRRDKGRLEIVPGDGLVVVEAPGDVSWKYPMKLTTAGSFYVKFAEKDLPTGTYKALLRERESGPDLGETTFQIEAYRIPTFEVTLHGPDQASLDREFEVSLTAAYYAGGKVGGQPVQWRVTQFPYAWTPKKREGFVYSSDERYSRSGRFLSSPRLDKADVTSEDGGAKLALNPAVEPTAEPRSFVIEATVTGPDDQTVTATRTVVALPPLVLGLKVPRYIERAQRIAGEMLVAGPDGALLPGHDVTVRLLRREWHSHLRASDFSDGAARYQTDVVDQKVSETTVKSGAEPSRFDLPIDRAGVYLIELEAHDRLGRAQVVRTDLYAGGQQPVSWAKPVSHVFSVVTDKARYDPGQTAQIVLKSPFQNARVLALVEAPEGNQYQWLDVVGGAASFPLSVRPSYAPRVPVHFLLMRGRLAGAAPQPGSAVDLGKPATLAATAWVTVNPLPNQASVTLQHPSTARPGQKMQVTVSLKDPAGKPLAGEVTLWLVDQAVLALGKERPLDPVPDFIRPVRSHLMAHDTRNLPFGFLPFAEQPGGDGGEGEESLLDRTTVRKNFKTVPYYNPALQVGPEGVATVSVELPDDLTVFKLRAKAVSGAERFGFGTGQVAVRLPLVVQPALPRFLRPGDSFLAGAIGRVVEGPGGPGSAEARLEGLELQGANKRTLDWAPGRPERLEFGVRVPSPSLDASGRPSRSEVVVRMGVSRTSDGASDAFEVRLPLRDDRERESRRQLADLQPGAPLAIPELGEKERPGSLRRSLLIADQPALVRMAAGLDFLREYPHGCTEQQLSRARTYVALRKFRALLQQAVSDKEADRAVKDTLAWISDAMDGNGLVAYWPGSSGSVSLTAWTLQFLIEARQGGYVVDDGLVARITRTLQQALRSDYGHFVDGEAFTERAWALAALAQAGQPDAAYAAELLGKGHYLDLEGKAQVLQALSRAGDKSAAADGLSKGMIGGVIVRLHQGRETYGGLQDTQAQRSGLVLPSETRTLAEMARALARREASHPRLPILVDALVTLGHDDGWGTTNANAAALLALSEVLQPASRGTPTRSVRVRLDGREQTLAVGGDKPLASIHGTTSAAGEVALAPGNGPLVMRVDTSWVPAEDGSRVAARSAGFVVTRELRRVGPEGTSPERFALTAPGTTQAFRVGEVVEEHVQVVNPKQRHYVAVVVPLAAGVEPLNPTLATAPPEARASSAPTLGPTYVAFLDDRVAYYYNSLPAGTYDFYFRTRATTVGEFIQPPAKAEMMYDAAVVGNSVGAKIRIERKGE